MKEEMNKDERNIDEYENKIMERIEKNNFVLEKYIKPLNKQKSVKNISKNSKSKKETSERDER